MIPSAKDLIQFLQDSPTPFHAVSAAQKRLDQAGFVALSEADAWELKPGGKYRITRNDSSLIAFRLGADLGTGGIRLIGAHTDSPGLKVKPQPDQKRQGHWTLGVETYGGVLMATWLDRDLSIAGKIAYLDHHGQLKTRLIDFKRPLGIIPNLAIHLRPGANEGWKINAQKELSPILRLPEEAQGDLRALIQQEYGPEVAEVLEFDLYLYPTEPPNLVGVRQELICGARLDNLVSCFAALEALAAQTEGPSAMVVFNDHEEVGSGTQSGAAGNFLESVLERILPDPQTRGRSLAQSWFLSSDNAHAQHPNHADLHDEAHAPLLGGGPVVKVNANQSYITDAESSARFVQRCRAANIPTQRFATRSDLRCGSTIGPLTARRIGIQGLDVGVPNLAMHSIRETIAAKDLDYLIQAMKAWLAE